MSVFRTIALRRNGPVTSECFGPWRVSLQGAVLPETNALGENTVERYLGLENRSRADVDL